MAFSAVQSAGLQPPPGSSDSLHSRQEVAALKEQLDKLLVDLESRSHELRATSRAHADMKMLLQQASEGHCAAEGRLQAEISTLRSELELKTQELETREPKTHELPNEDCAQAEADLVADAAPSVQGQGPAEGQLTAALRSDLDASSLRLQAVQAELGANQQALAGKQQEVELLQQALAGKQRELEGRQQELQATAQSYAELEDLLSRASEEQSMSEGKLTTQLTILQDEVKVLFSNQAIPSWFLHICSTAI